MLATITSGLAVALPTILAVMGVVVAFYPPSKETLLPWVAAFVVLGLIAIITGVLDRLNADRAIKGLQDSIDTMTKPVASDLAARPARDPDAIYQHGSIVGKVVAARVTLNESKVYFEQVENAGNLNTKATFEYRDYVLTFLRADSFIGMLVQALGGVKTSVYQRVVCEIVGRAN